MAYRANKIIKDADMTAFNLRLTADLRLAIQKRAETNGRSINAEILAMLTLVISSRAPREVTPMLARQDVIPYNVGAADEEMLLRIYRAMPVEKRLALLSLFK